MTDVTATVISTTNINASIDVQSIPTVQAVGIQGQSANQTNLAGIADVDALLPDNGSVLVYKASTNKWTATTVLDSQDVTGGQY